MPSSRWRSISQLQRQPGIDDFKLHTGRAVPLILTQAIGDVDGLTRFAGKFFAHSENNRAERAPTLAQTVSHPGGKIFPLANLCSRSDKKRFRIADAKGLEQFDFRARGKPISEKSSCPSASSNGIRSSSVKGLASRGFERV